MNSKEVKKEVKNEIKKEKKTKVKKIRKPLNLSGLSSDEELNDSSKDYFGRNRLDLRTRLAESRIHAIQSCRRDVEDLSEDVFNDKPLTAKTELKKSNKTKKEMEDILSLLDDLNQNNENDVKNEVIVEEFDPTVICTQNSYNTRSSAKNSGRNKSVTKKVIKKTPKRRKSGRKSKETEFDEQKAFERLDGMQAMDDIEIFEELNTSLNVSRDTEGYIKDRDIEIKVKYNAVIEKFPMKTSEKFSKIMPLIAHKFDENISELIFRLNDKPIDSDSTPQSVDLTISDIIECYKRVANKSVNCSKDPNVLSLKLKDKTMKTGLTLNINKFDKIQNIIEWFSQQKSLPAKKFRLEFDAERLEPSSTIAECDIDDDSQIDVILL